MFKFKLMIQGQSSETGLWENIQQIDDSIKTSQKIRKSFLFWNWTKEEAVYTERTEADCRKVALEIAKHIDKYISVRIIRGNASIHRNPIDDSWSKLHWDWFPIWENGKWL